jgi:hypothetical protein
VWFTWDGHTLYFATASSSQKAKNLAHEPWVVFHAGDGDDVIILEGKVDVVTEECELDRVDVARGEKYVDPGSGARDTIRVEGTMVYRLATWHAMAWMYGNMDDRTDWSFDGATLRKDLSALVERGRTQAHSRPQAPAPPAR